ncbi:cystatin-A/B [Mytilus galloprovincialis]|uniref:Cystatin-A/B n=1 Tax=Mytilus galloprovincialis TaxID=29158 RepID=A0A8B6BUQ4_MYTGA|nr:cystatin-A/B [Mytilus galloprovincialis]
MMCGGLGNIVDADDDVKVLVEQVRRHLLTGAVNEKTGKNYGKLAALKYGTQVVAGTNYFVKVKSDDGSILHLRIYQPLPHTNQPAELHSVQENKSEEETLTYF